MFDAFSDWPVGWLFVAGVLGAAARSQSTYWIGRAVGRGVASRWQERVEGPRVQQAIRSIERWGMPIIPFSFATVGFQTAVNAGAGVIRINWLRYTLWAVPGWFVWSAIWMGGGIAAVAGAVSLWYRSPWALVVTAVIVVAGTVAFVLVRRRRREQADDVERLAQVAHHPQG